MADPGAEQAASLAKSDPRGAIELGEAVLARSESSDDQALAYWALGQAYHELGRNSAAWDSLGRAAEIADEPLRSKIEVTIASIASATGLSSEAKTRLRVIVESGHEEVKGLALSQLGLIKLYDGDAADAVGDLEQSISMLQSAEDFPALARVRNNLGWCYLLLGRYRLAVRALGLAIDEASATNQTFVAAAATQNLGYAQAQLGDLPRALTSLEAARLLYQQLGDPSRGVAGLYDDLAETYRLAGLTADAVRYARVGSWIARRGDNVERQAEAEYRRAVCLLEHGNRQAAANAAKQAVALFGRSGRHLWRQRAELITIEASSNKATGSDTVERISALADDLLRVGYIHEPRSLVNRLAHRLLDDGRPEAAEELLYRRRDFQAGLGGEDVPELGLPSEESVLDRLELYYQTALAAVLRGEPAAALLSRIRTTVVEHTVALGDQELRAGSVRLTERFRSLAVRDALLGHGSSEPSEKARRVLLAEEEWRALGLTLPRAVAAVDDETVELLVELRQANRKASEEVAESDPSSTAERGDKRAEMEDRLRIRAMTARPSARNHDPEESPLDRGTLAEPFIDELVDQLVDTAIIEWIEHNGELVGVSVAGDGDVNMWSAGTLGEAERLARFIHQSLGDLNVATDDATARSVLADLREDCGELRQLLWPEESDKFLSPGVFELSVARVPHLVLSPPAALTALPWRMIAGTPSNPVGVTLTPSLENWGSLRLPSTGDDLFERAAVVCGPGLLTGSADEAVVKRVLPHIEVLGEGEAECERVKDVLTSVQFVHLACHGSFRPESPRFSSLTMTDGPLTLFELDWLEKVPDVVMLAACDSGKVSSRPGGELLGTAPALLAAGASTVIAPICPVRDQEVSEALVPFYQALAHGPSAAARAMDEAVADGRPELVATAAAFQVVGATVEFVDR